MLRTATLTALLLSGCAPDATGNWQGFCWMDLSPAVYSDPATDLGPHEWAFVIELEEDSTVLSGDFDYDSSFDGSSATGDIEGNRDGEVDLEMVLSFINGNEQGRFEMVVEHEKEDLRGDVEWYNDKDNTLQADGDCTLDYRF